MNIIERIKEREVLSAEIEVKFDDGVLTVARLGQVQKEAASKEALNSVRAEGLDPQSEAGDDRYRLYYGAAIGRALKSYVKKWSWDFPFNGPNLNSFFETLTLSDAFFLGASYFIAEEEDRKKKVESSPPSGSS